MVKDTGDQLQEAGTEEALRADVKRNLEREVKFRLNQRNKQAVMDALIGMLPGGAR